MLWDVMSRVLSTVIEASYYNLTVFILTNEFDYILCIIIVHTIRKEVVHYRVYIIYLPPSVIVLVSPVITEVIDMVITSMGSITMISLNVSEITLLGPYPVLRFFFIHLLVCFHEYIKVWS